ncbi:hypothetical protein BH20ACT22_BH20ACT22_15230 [soil metagenome]
MTINAVESAGQRVEVFVEEVVVPVKVKAER